MAGPEKGMWGGPVYRPNLECIGDQKIVPGEFYKVVFNEPQLFRGEIVSEAVLYAYWFSEGNTSQVLLGDPGSVQNYPEPAWALDQFESAQVC